jgi:RNA polymerase-binding transcription factor DksA
LDRESEADSIGEIAPSSQHEADVGSETFERERDLSLLIEFRNELSEIEPALARLTQGSYGVCAGCYEPIDRDRLEAVPATRYCKACQDRYELGGALAAEPVTAGAGIVIDAAEFLPDDDELEDLGPAQVERRLVPKRGGVHLRRRRARRSRAARRAGRGRCRKRVAQRPPQDRAGRTGHPHTGDEWRGGSVLEERRDEELVEANRQTEDLEGDLSVAIRRQIGLDDELDRDEIPAVPAGYEQVPRPRQSDEFLCSTCFQLKRRTQLADPDRSRWSTARTTSPAEHSVRLRKSQSLFSRSARRSCAFRPGPEASVAAQ